MIDLHTHSTFSDGILTPEQLVAKACEGGLSAIALTDHDTVSGIEPFLKAAYRCHIKGIPGIEFSVDDELGNGGQVHIIGLFVDHTSSLLLDYSEKMKKRRLERNAKILDKIRDLGLDISDDEVLSISSDGVIGRAHIARLMMQKGFIKSVQEAFEKYIGPGKPAFVSKPKFLPSEIIGLIHQTGGLAILAHPMYLNIPDFEDLTRFILSLKNDGLDGVEVIYPGTPVKMAHHLTRLAEKENLLVSGGSDFHGSTVRPHIYVGKGRGELYIPDSLLEKMEIALNK